MKNTAGKIKNRRDQRKSRRSLEASLTLTSLVDVFSVLVIYLLVATSFGSEVEIIKGMDLPKAGHSSAVKPSLMVNIINNQIVFDKKSVSLARLSQLLVEQRGDMKSITIQADKKASFSDINPIVLTGLNAGFTDIQFAVMQEDEV